MAGFSQEAGAAVGCASRLTWSANRGLTRKRLLTYSVRMVAASTTEPDVFTAISHAARRQMLDLLAGSDYSVKAIAGHFRMSRPAVAKEDEA